MAAKYSDLQPDAITIESDDDNEDIQEFTREPTPSDVSEENIIPLIEQEERTNCDGYEHGCYSCSKEVPVKSVREIKPGKHLTRKGNAKLFGRFYNHHLLCQDIQYLPDNKALVTVIHKAPKNGGNKKDAKVHKARIRIDLNVDKYNIVVYTNPKYTDTEIVQRAEQLLLKCEKEETCHNNGEKTDGDYNLFLSNCEHFVTFCTTGHDESKQVYKFFSKFQGIFKQGSSIPNKIVTLMNYLDDAGNTIRRTKIGFGVGIALSILVFIWQVGKLIHTKCRKGLCTFCKNQKMRKYGLDILFLLGEIGLSVVLMLAFSLAFWQGLLVGLGLALGTFFIKWFIKKMITIFARPRYTTTDISDISLLEPGDIIEYKYWLIDHLGVIVDIQQIGNKKQLSIIHFGLEKLLDTREIIEEKVLFSSSKPGLKKVDFFEKPHFENEMVVVRAKSRLGEKNWNGVKNTSFHFCHWCKVKSMEEGIKIALEPNENMQQIP